MALRDSRWVSYGLSRLAAWTADKLAAIESRQADFCLATDPMDGTRDNVPVRNEWFSRRSSFTCSRAATRWFSSLGWVHVTLSVMTSIRRQKTTQLCSFPPPVFSPCFWSKSHFYCLGQKSQHSEYECGGQDTIEDSPMRRPHTLRGFELSFRSFAWGIVAPVIAVVVLCGHASAHAAGLTIDATFDSSITNDPNAAAIEAAINAAIANVEANITSPNNITVKVLYQEVNTGLGSSLTSVYTDTYFGYYNALKTVMTSPTQLTALNSLGPAPTGPSSGNPVNQGTSILFTSAEGRNIGINTPGNVSVPGVGTFDSVVGLNTSITFPPLLNNGSNYFLQAVATHETDEVLGIGGPGSTLGSPFPQSVGVTDLYRHSAPGARSWSTSAPSAYFSIDGGNTNLTNFNQAGGGSDFGDWAGVPGSPQVQDAFGTPGATPTLGSNEITAFAAIGYGVLGQAPVPEPSTLTMLGTAVLAASGYGSSRRTRRAIKSAA
jgi:hypothetical protein